MVDVDRDEAAHVAGGGRFQAGPEEILGGRPAGRGPRWWYWLIPAAVVALVIAVVTQRGKPSAAPASRTPSASSPAAPATSPVVTPFALSELLDETGGWELFGRGTESVVRLQVAADRITTTTFGGLGSGGPVSFVAGSNEVIIRPLDNVRGYAIPDGRPARELTAALGEGGFALPGPDPDHVWWQTGTEGRTVMKLIGLDGRPSGISVPVPARFRPYPAPDGAGYLLLTQTDGRAVYDARPGSLRRVTIGTVLAIGPTGWLIRECATTHDCTTAMVERATGTRHALHDIDAYLDGSTGLISPDGATAAMTDPVNASVHLVTPATGVDRPLDVRVDTLTDGAIVWSPDSRWLFVADRFGDLAAVERRTGQVRHFGTVLPELSQLAIRPAPG